MTLPPEIVEALQRKYTHIKRFETSDDGLLGNSFVIRAYGHRKALQRHITHIEMRQVHNPYALINDAFEDLDNRLAIDEMNEDPQPVNHLPGFITDKEYKKFIQNKRK